MASHRFQNVDGSAFVGQVFQKSSAAAVTAGALKPSAIAIINSIVGYLIMLERPIFLFFANFADYHFDLLEKNPPLASAIQSLETCLLLVSMDRYPSAMASCAMALESAWKAASKKGPEINVNFAEILGDINAALPKEAPTFDFKKFRTLRNNIVHFGYTPKDDDIAAKLIFSIGIPTFFLYVNNHPELSVDFQSCLDPDLFDHLNLTMKLNDSNAIHKNISPVDSSLTLRHWIKRTLICEPIWQDDALNQHNLGGLVEFEVKDKLRQLFHDSWETCEDIQCPVCGQEQLVVQLDSAAIEKKSINALKGHCLNCDLNFQPGGRHLLNYFINRSLSADAKERILKSYGF